MGFGPGSDRKRAQRGGPRCGRPRPGRQRIAPLEIGGAVRSPSIAPALPLSFEPPGWLDVAHFLSPNLVDYFTKTPPPPPPFPPIPGKIPSLDNPYAGPAILEAATWLPLGPERAMFGPLISAARLVEKGAAEAALEVAKVAAGRASTPGTLERLQAHLDNALARLERDGLTEARKRSLKYYPQLEAAHRGERIDTFAKETIATDEYLAHLKITPRFQFGPDIYDDINKVWYDVTTLKQWAAHERKYTPGFGQGTPLFYGGKWTLKFGSTWFTGNRSTVPAFQRSTGALICEIFMSRNRVRSRH